MESKKGHVGGGIYRIDHDMDLHGMPAYPRPKPIEFAAWPGNQKPLEEASR